MFVDIDCTQEKKYNQNAYGDYFLSKRYPDEGRLIAVLSDGLGSGVKANILACMTSTMLLKFIEAESDIKQACEIIMNALPVCKVRKISYSTFSAIDCNEDGVVKIVEEGNPAFILVRDGEVVEQEYTTITSKTFQNRRMRLYSFKLQLGDRLIFCSDGVTQSGLGSQAFRLGFRREGLIKSLLPRIKNESDISSSKLSKLIVKQALLNEVDRKAKDDISAVVIYAREPREALVFTGPPYHSQRDNEYACIFDGFKGKKAICGGTTANLVARELKREVKTQISNNIGKLPSCSEMENVDLVTEGILTLTKASEYLETPSKIVQENAATRLVNFFLDSDCINFMVGAKLNQAHYDPNLPIEIEIRKNVIKKIAKILEDKFIKKVVVQYI